MNSDNELPLDYEPCGICGWDHQYEPTEASFAHQQLDRENAQEWAAEDARDAEDEGG